MQCLHLTLKVFCFLYCFFFSLYFFFYLGKAHFVLKKTKQKQTKTAKYPHTFQVLMYPVTINSHKWLTQIYRTMFSYVHIPKSDLKKQTNKKNSITFSFIIGVYLVLCQVLVMCFGMFPDLNTSASNIKLFWLEHSHWMLLFISNHLFFPLSGLLWGEKLRHFRLWDRL